MPKTRATRTCANSSRSEIWTWRKWTGEHRIVFVEQVIIGTNAWCVLEQPVKIGAKGNVRGCFVYKKRNPILNLDSLQQPFNIIPKGLLQINEM